MILVGLWPMWLVSLKLAHHYSEMRLSFVQSTWEGQWSFRSPVTDVKDLLDFSARILHGDTFSRLHKWSYRGHFDCMLRPSNVFFFW